MADNVVAELVDDDEDEPRIATSSSAVARVGRLDGAEYIYREQAKVIRDVRAGRMRSDDGYRLVRMFGELRLTRETMILEREIEELQRAAGIRR